MEAESTSLYERLGGIYSIAKVGDATGGPQRYTGRAMNDSHRDLVITADEWRAFIDDLNQTFDKFAVPQQERSELLAIIDSTRDDIVIGPTA